MTPGYVPRQGDVVWVDFNPQAGHEQAGRRPAVVLSSSSYNRPTELMVCCPVTNQHKGYPFEIALGEMKKAQGVVLADQIKSLDWKSRNATFMDRVTAEVLAEILGKAATLLRVAKTR